MSVVDRKMQAAVGAEAVGAFYNTLTLQELVEKICNKNCLLAFQPGVCVCVCVSVSTGFCVLYGIYKHLATHLGSQRQISYPLPLFPPSHLPLPFLVACFPIKRYEVALWGQYGFARLHIGTSLLNNSSTSI